MNLAHADQKHRPPDRPPPVTSRAGTMKPYSARRLHALLPDDIMPMTLEAVYMDERTNEQWLAALGRPGPEGEDALADLRALLVRGLSYAMADRPQVGEADIEGFVQDALLKILDHLDSFRGESRFTTWAQKIAVHEAFTELRRKRWENVSLDEMIAQYGGDFTPSVLADTVPSPEAQLTQRALLELVRRLIVEDLTDRQRQAILGVVFAGMPTEEVARRMGTNRNALYKLMHDARQRLKRCLQAEGVSLESALAAFEPAGGKRYAAYHVKSTGG